MMSARRSRFKVAANIPVRRKAVVGGLATDSIANNDNADLLEPATAVGNNSEENISSSSSQEKEVKNDAEDKPVAIGVITLDQDEVFATQNISEKNACKTDKPVFRKVRPQLRLPRRAKVNPELVEVDVKRIEEPSKEKPLSTIDIEERCKEKQLSTIDIEEPSIEKQHPTIDIEEPSQGNQLSEHELYKLEEKKLVDNLPFTGDVINSPVPLANSPVKTPSRTRFMRPALAESAVRRYSVHVSSASESEDESRRIQRLRRISENTCLAGGGRVPGEVRVVTPVPALPDPLLMETSDEVDGVECARLSFLPKKKAKVSNFVRKVAEARRDFNRKFAKKKPDRGNLKMFDLLFYNPANSPLKTAKEKPTLENKKEEVDNNQSVIEEEEVDDPGDEEEGAEEAEVPVPQVKIGTNGEIILDEKSLVIETTAAKKSRQALESAVPIFEDRHRKYAYYGKKGRSNKKEWTPIETKCFYKAINCLGTDFALMQSIFPDRTRAELKNKFKREERCNGALVDKALSKPGTFNILLLKGELEQERKKVSEERNRQLQERAIEENRRRNKERQKECSVAETKSVAVLRNFLERTGKSADDENKGPLRRSRRVPHRRYFQDSEIDADTRKCSIEEENDPFPLCSDEVDDTTHSKVCNKAMVSRETTKIIKRNRSSHASLLTLGGFVEKEGKKLTPAPLSRIFRVESNLKNLKTAQVQTAAETREARICSDHDYSVGPMESPNNRLNCSDHQQNMEECETETIYTFPSVFNNCDYDEQVSTRKNYSENPAKISTCTSDLGGNSLNNISTLREDWSETVEEEPLLGRASYDIIDSKEINEVLMIDDMRKEECPVEEQSSPILGLHLDFPQPSVENQDVNPSIEGLNEEEVMELATEKSEHVLVGDEEEVGVNYRTTGGFEYALIESATSEEQRRTYLAGLRPGSFVFMSTVAPDVPLERRCSMYMIAEKTLPDGRKEFTPMPVLLPPELMKLITNELNCA